MQLVKFKQSNDVLNPSGELTEDMLEDDFIIADEIPMLRLKDSPFITVCAKLNYEELEQIKATGKIYIRVYAEEDTDIKMIGDTLLEPKLGIDYFSEDEISEY